MDVSSLTLRANAAYHAATDPLRAQQIEREEKRQQQLFGQSEDELSISEEAMRAFEAEQEQGDGLGDESRKPGDPESQQLQELEARDREVRAHEQAHKAAAGDLASGGPTYTYQTGPDGQRYAIGGEVKIQLREGNTPEETVRNMERAKRAALAPGQPSSQDRAVAAEASRLANEARREANAGEDEDESKPNRRRLDLYA